MTCRESNEGAEKQDNRQQYEQALVDIWMLSFGYVSAALAQDIAVLSMIFFLALTLMTHPLA